MGGLWDVLGFAGVVALVRPVIEADFDAALTPAVKNENIKPQTPSPKSTKL